MTSLPSLPSVTLGDEPTAEPPAELRPVETDQELAGRPSTWATPQSRVPIPPRLADEVVPHEEIFSLTNDEATSAEAPRLIANVPSTPHDALPSIAPSERHAVGLDDGPLSEKPTLPETIEPPATYPRAVAAPDPAWHEPVTLLQRLDELASDEATREWATQTAGRIRELNSSAPERSSETNSIFRRLEELSSQAVPLASTLRDGTRASKLLRAGHALRRRLDIWQRVAQLGPPAPQSEETTQVDPEQLALCLAGIDTITDDSVEGKAWREYLLVDALRQWAARRPSPEDRLPRALAQRALERLTRIPMNASQRQFVTRRPMAALQDVLRRRTAEPVDPARLLADLERYEQTGLGSDARLLAEDCLDLSFSPGDRQRQLADRLQQHYRNANMRVAVTAELLNRLMPKREPEYATVSDKVLGLPVHGRSLTSTEVGVRLIPDPSRARMALEINGQVASLTSSTSGVATFYNDSQSAYTARKPVEIDLRGIHLSPAEVKVYNRTRLRGLRTEFDPIPLVGPLVKGVARSEHERQRAAAIREIKRKIAWKARQRIDTEADTRLGEVSQRLRQRVLNPLNALLLEPTLVSSKTTERRLTMRLRLAGGDQLGSHTPRPREPSDSLASFQVHESAINNALQRLQLEGRTFTLPELSRHVAARLGQTKPWEIDPDHDDLEIAFAEKDAVAVRLRDGRAELMLAIDRLSKPPRTWKNFQARVFFRPGVDGRSAELSRDGTVSLTGSRLGTSSRIALSSVFAQVFPKQRPTYLTPERLESDPKFADLELTQFLIDDGWLGLALVPKPKQSIQQTAFHEP